MLGGVECGGSSCGLRETGKAVAAVVHKMAAWDEGQWRWREAYNFWRDWASETW